MARTLFIADLHLAPDLTRITQGFLQFLQQAQGADALYVLGDLFEVWVGDDNHNVYNDTIVAGFSALSDSGTRLFFMHGNRDFLLGPAFAASCGGELLGEEAVINCHGHRLLIMHGDQLCTLDEKYMAFRAQSRDPAWQTMMLEKPLDQRLMIASMWRAQSQALNANKPENIMDVTPDEVVAALERNGVTTLLHGHTHRPGEQAVPLAQGTGRRLVLGDWREASGTAVVGVIDEASVRLEDLTFA